MEELRNHLVIVIALEHYNPLSQLRALGENGVRPVFIAINHRVRMASASKWPSKVHLVETEEDAFEVLMKEYGDVAEKTGYKPILSFSDDKTVTFYDRMYDELKDKFIMFNAGETGRITKFMRKKEIVDCARRHGVPVAPDWRVENGQIPADIEYPVITKAFSPVEGCYKGDFHICMNEAELKEAFEGIESDMVFIQKYIDKKTETTYEGFSYNHGKGMYVGVQTDYIYPTKGYYSPLMNVYPRVDASLQERLDEMLAEIGFEGIWEIEFLVDKDDKLYFLEINFRHATWGYSANVAGSPLPYLWAQAMLTGKAPEQKQFEPFIAMVEPIDFGLRVDKGVCTLAEWLTDFKRAKCTYYYNEQDMEPWKVVVENWDRLK